MRVHQAGLLCQGNVLEVPTFRAVLTGDSLMFWPTAEDLRREAKWDGAAGDSRNQLLSELSGWYISSIPLLAPNLIISINSTLRHDSGASSSVAI